MQTAKSCKPARSNRPTFARLARRLALAFVLAVVCVLSEVAYALQTAMHCGRVGKYEAHGAHGKQGALLGAQRDSKRLLRSGAHGHPVSQPVETPVSEVANKKRLAIGMPVGPKIEKLSQACHVYLNARVRLRHGKNGKMGNLEENSIAG